MELGIQAGVFAIFDLNSQSFDLINADYLVGIPLTIKTGNFANLTRIFHQSSHLGDEFLLRGQTNERINLSYEAVNSLLSLSEDFEVFSVFDFHPAVLGFRSKIDKIQDLCDIMLTGPEVCPVIIRLPA